MDNYKILKINKQQTEELKNKGLEIEKGKIYPESTVDSMCSQNFEIYDEDDGKCEGDCIDCLVKYKIVELVKDRYSIQGGIIGYKQYDTLEELSKENMLDLDEEQTMELMQEGEIVIEDNMSNEFIIYIQNYINPLAKKVRIDIG